MEFRLKKEMQEENIRVALADYARHINGGKDVMEDVSEDFISAVASDNVENKNELRELFRAACANAARNISVKTNFMAYMTKTEMKFRYARVAGIIISLCAVAVTIIILTRA